MKKLIAVTFIGLLALVPSGAQQKGAQKKEIGPQPPMVGPAGPDRAPSDAIVLFDGKDLSKWMGSGDQPADWLVKDGAMVCRTGAGDIHTRERFRSAQIHLEFNVPSMPEYSGQARGNSGVMLHDRTTEIQILDSYENPTYADGVCGALYGVAAALVNAVKRPGEWQTYDIVFHAPTCGADGKAKTMGSLTLVHNGVLVLDHVPAAPRTGCVEEGSLILQDHNGFGGKPKPASAQLKAPVTPMRFRNIWIRKLGN